MTSCLKNLCLKYSASYTFYCRIYNVLKILNEGSINYEGVYRRAPATPGLLLYRWATIQICSFCKYGAVQCSAVHCKAVYCSVVQCSALK